MVGVAGRFLQTSVSTTVADLLGGRPVPARACDTTPIALPAGAQELLISPGPAFIADGAALTGPLARDLTTAVTTPVGIDGWEPDRRSVTVPRAPVSRVLVVPESVNPGWLAHNADGAALTPVIVNGWQQGWVLPAGEQGTVTLSFPSNGPYRAGLAAGLALLPLLLAMALIPARRPVPDYPPARPRQPGPLGVAALLGVGGLIGGAGGLAVFAAAMTAGAALRRRRPDSERLALIVAPAGLILAGALLSRYPWRSVDGYIGYSPWVQLPALICLAALAASLLPVPRRRRPDPQSTPPP